MSEFDGFMDEFTDWLNQDAEIYENQTTYDAYNTPTKAWVKIASGPVGIYTENTRVSSTADRYSDQNTGRVIIDPTLLEIVSGQTLDYSAELKIVIGDKDYYIEGEDDIGLLGQVVSLLYRRQYLGR